VLSLGLLWRYFVLKGSAYAMHLFLMTTAEIGFLKVFLIIFEMWNFYVNSEFDSLKASKCRV